MNKLTCTCKDFSNIKQFKGHELFLNPSSDIRMNYCPYCESKLKEVNNENKLFMRSL